MPRKSTLITVWILSRHPLAIDHVRCILKGNRNLRLVVCTEFASLPPESKESNLVAVIDQQTVAAFLPTSIQSMRQQAPHARIIVLGNELAPEQVCNLLFLGIRAFLTYSEAAKHLHRAIERVVEGHLWVRTDVLEYFVRYAPKLAQSDYDGQRMFTVQQKSILLLLRRRLSNKEIAVKMGISERTVKFHLGNIFEKVGLHDRYAVMEMVREGKLGGLEIWNDRDMPIAI